MRSAEHLALLASKATGGPWQTELSARNGLYLVCKGAEVIEHGLPQAMAAYLVLLRTIADKILKSDLSRRQRKCLAAQLARQREAVNSDWVFTAKNIEDDRFYLHNCLEKLGGGSLTEANAKFIDAAKRVLPKSLSGQSVEPDTCHAVFLPYRTGRYGPGTVDVVGEYERFAAPERRLHHMSGRYDVSDRTIAAIASIREHLPLLPTDHLLDIGCGDAMFFRQVGHAVASGTGTVVSNAELDRLRATPDLSRFAFYRASFDDFSAVPKSFDVIIANGCFHFVMDLQGAHRAFSAMVNRLRPGGRIWIGELPTRNHRSPRGFATPQRALAHSWGLYGSRFALRYAIHLIRRRHRSHVILEKAKRDPWWICKTDNMARIAAMHGLKIIASWDCEDLTRDTFYRAEGRRSYLLCKS